MASKYERLQSRFKTFRKRTERGAIAALHTAETLGATALTGFAMGRLSDENGDWGFRGVPYPLLGAGGLLLVGLFADKYQEDLMALGTGTAAPWVGLKMYSYGVEMKDRAKTAGVRRPGYANHRPQIRERQPFVPPVSAPAQQSAPVKSGTAFDGV